LGIANVYLNYYIHPIRPQQATTQLHRCTARQVWYHLWAVIGCMVCTVSEVGYITSISIIEVSQCRSQLVSYTMG